MNPNDPYQQPQPPVGNGSGGLPPIQPIGSQTPVQPSAPQPQSYTTQYDQQQFNQPYEPPGAPATGQPAVDYGMQPSNQQREQFSIDYLNKIAPQEQKTVNRFAVFGLIGGVLFAAIFAVVIMMNSTPPSAGAQLPDVTARVGTLQKVVAAQQSHLNATQLSEANAAIGSTLSSLNADLTGVMKTRKIKISKALETSEKTYGEKLSKTLEDSYQKGTLDRTYPSQMTYELSVLRSKFVKLKKASSATEIDAACDDATKNIDLTLKTYAAFDAAKS